MAIFNSYVKLPDGMGQNGILKTRTSVLAHFFFSHRLFLWIFVISLACPLNIANSTTLLDTH